ncbi:roundabout [Nesidiocoris tenuis]|uniref:Roundabout n=1 Tax=Nesidiocoris tenuis TaxID=355587 RepID=A0ABN7BFL8_9HEMI|nr:roundabout [Nesidiocoris tenuis]
MAGSLIFLFCLAVLSPFLMEKIIDGAHRLQRFAEVLKDEFKVVPKDLKVAAGEEAILECHPPDGNPPPSLFWRKDGEIIDFNERLKTMDQGSLKIVSVRASDEGKYQCVVQNIVGLKESPPASLTVHVKPYFTKAPPQDITAVADSTVELPCVVDGDPVPTVTWRREEGALPPGRYDVTTELTLRIERIHPDDEGAYFCEATNPVGNATAKSVLTVHSAPVFVVKPEDETVALNGVAKFECVARGNPPPTLFWSREGTQNLLYPSRTDGRFSVSAKGQLSVTGVLREDAGFYVCSALSVAGSAVARAYLQVTSINDKPPPIIEIGPVNQTLPLQSFATLPCQVLANPPAKVVWYKDGEVLEDGDRITILPSGTIRIDELELTDSGEYTCTGSSEAGTSTWSAWLTVERSPGAELHRAPDPSTYPRAPSTPRVVNASSNSLTVAWDPPSGTSTLIGYRLEYFSPELQTGWVTAAMRVISHTFTLSDLKPDTGYMFIVRAENNQGLSIPSGISEPARTLREGAEAMAPHQLDEARSRLANRIVVFKDLVAVSSTSATAHWEILSDDYYEGVYIRYREIPGWNKFHMVTVNKPDVSEYTVKELKKYTRYEFFLMPFYKSIEGHPTISKIVQTLEDVPSGPPQNVEIEIVNATAAYVRWSPPAQDHHNGVLQGYKLQVKGNSTKVLAELTMNPTSTHLLLNNLTSKGAYSVRVAAFTSSGMGSWSEQVTLATGQARGLRAPKSGETWLVLLVIVMALLLGLACSSVLYLRRRQSNKQLGHLSVPVVNTNNLTLMRTGTKDGGVWLDRDWATEMSKQDEQMECVRSETECADYAEVDTKQLATYYASGNANKEGPTPYATTTLLARPQNCPLRHSPEISNIHSQLHESKSTPSVEYNNMNTGQQQNIYSNGCGVRIRSQQQLYGERGEDWGDYMHPSSEVSDHRSSPRVNNCQSPKGVRRSNMSRESLYDLPRGPPRSESSYSYNPNWPNNIPHHAQSQHSIQVGGHHRRESSGDRSTSTRASKGSYNQSSKSLRHGQRSDSRNDRHHRPDENTSLLYDQQMTKLNRENYRPRHDYRDNCGVLEIIQPSLHSPVNRHIGAQSRREECSGGDYSDCSARECCDEDCSSSYTSDICCSCSESSCLYEACPSQQHPQHRP